MINFIIVEKNNAFLEQLIIEIDSIMLDSKIEYTVYSFNDFSNQFKTLITLDLDNKFYILNAKIEDCFYTIKEIRKTDLYSLIILIDGTAFINSIFKNQLLIISIIDKLNGWKVELRKVIDLLVLNINKNILVLKKNKTTYSIHFNSIIYIEYKSHYRTSIIYTESDVYEFRISLSQLLKMLPKSFEKQGKTHIINTNKKED